jgi:hypothetical protein
MKTFMLCTALLLLACSSARAADKREQTFVIGADVNSQGEVTQTQPEASVTKPIAAVLDLALKRWRFVPAQQNGKAVSAHTFVEAKLEATPDDAGKYSLRVSYIRHGPTWDRRLAPGYPLNAIRNYAAGIVAMRGSLQSDGRIVITDIRTALSGNSESLLRKASTDWFLQHKSVPETVDGSPVPAQIRVYITFRLNALGGGQEKSASEGPHSAEERELLHQAGFKDSEIDAKIGSPVISSVLQASMINPVIIRL